MINAIAKRRLAFRDADGKFITVKPGEFVTLPDAVTHDPMYAWAVKDGVLVVSQQVIAPVTADVPEAPAPAEEAPVEEEPAEEAPAKAAEGKPSGKGKTGTGKGKTGTGKKAADK